MTTAAPHHVLLLGGYGRVAQLLTPLLLQRSWSVTSIIRNPDQVAPLQQLGQSSGAGGHGKLNVLVRSIEGVKSEAQAKSLIDEVKPDYVVWSAGAGGKGPPERTEAVDRDAASHFIRASAATPSVTKFVMISFIGCRLRKPAWVSEADWEHYVSAKRAPLQRYYEAKIAADQVLYEEGRKRGKDFAAVGLRPGTLTAEPTGRVDLGKLKRAEGNVSRASVAHLVALLLDNPGVESCWLDMLDGDEDPETAVKRCVEKKVDAVEGEPFAEN